MPAPIISYNFTCITLEQTNSLKARYITNPAIDISTLIKIGDRLSKVNGNVVSDNKIFVYSIDGSTHTITFTKDIDSTDNTFTIDVIPDITINSVYNSGGTIYVSFSNVHIGALTTNVQISTDSGVTYPFNIIGNAVSPRNMGLASLLPASVLYFRIYTTEFLPYIYSNVVTYNNAPATTTTTTIAPTTTTTTTIPISTPIVISRFPTGNISVGDTVTFTIISGVTDYNYTSIEWYLGDKLVGTENPLTVKFDTPNIYNMTVKVIHYTNKSWLGGHFYGGTFNGNFSGGTFHYGTLNNHYISDIPKSKKFIFSI